MNKVPPKQSTQQPLQSNQQIHLHAEVPMELAQQRLDKALAELFPEHSRSRLKEWIEQGSVKVNGQILRPKDKLIGSEQIEIQAELPPVISWEEGESLPLNIIYEDDDILVINKQANLVVHPASGNMQGTLVNALLYHQPDLKKLPRAGIVHRLDKDTTGLLVVAKTLASHTALVEMLQTHLVNREYEAIVWGVMTGGGTVDAPIDRNPYDRKKMAVVDMGKSAITHYRVLKRFKSHTHVQLKLETGRTHQIRVHMAHIHYPIVGDKTYGGRLRVPPGASEELIQFLRSFPRQALHARRLGFDHPITGEPMLFEAPLPLDMIELLENLGRI